MKDSQDILFSEEPASDDEIDSLFGQLQVIEPPSSLVERILIAAARLPHPVCDVSIASDVKDSVCVCDDTGEL